MSALLVLFFGSESIWFIRYGAEVENYLEVYLKTPGLLKSDVARALLARGNARNMGGEKLLAKAEQGTAIVYIIIQKTIIMLLQISKPS